MTDLSTIDFSKLKLPDWQVRGLCAESNHGRVFMRTQAGCTVAARDINGQWTVMHQDATFAELRALESICSQVDSFIVSERKRIEEEKLPPWRECTMDEALANPECSEWLDDEKDNDGDWHTMSELEERDVWYRYRTRAPKTEVVRREFERLRGLVPNTEEIGILQGLLVHTPKPPVPTAEEQTRVDETIAEVTGCKRQVDRIRVEAISYRTPQQMAEFVTSEKANLIPNLPKVRAPEGLEWQLVNGCGFQAVKLVDAGSGVCDSKNIFDMPRNKLERDAMLTCVAAYDLEHGEAPTVVVSSIRHERINCVTMPPSLSGELGGVTDSDADKLFSRRFLLVEVEP